MIRYFVKEDIDRLRVRLEELIEFKRVYDETNKLKKFFQLELNFEQGVQIYKKHSKYMRTMHSEKKIENTLVKYFYNDDYIQNNFLKGKCSFDEAIRIYKSYSSIHIEKVQKCLNKQIIKYFKKEKVTQNALNYKLTLKEFLEFEKYYRQKIKIACIQAIIVDVAYGYLVKEGVITKADLRNIKSFAGNYYKYNEEVEIDEKRDLISESYSEPIVDLGKILFKIANAKSLKYKAASYYDILYDEALEDDLDYKEIREIGRKCCEDMEEFYDIFQTDMSIACINNFNAKQEYIDWFYSANNRNSEIGLTDEIFNQNDSFYVSITDYTMYSVIDSELLLIIILAMIDKDE